MENTFHDFWDMNDGSEYKNPKADLYPPHKGRKNTPKQRKENKAWAISHGGVEVGDWNPTYVLFQNCVYNTYNNDLYKPVYFANRYVIRLYKMERGLYKDQKTSVEQSFDWNDLLNNLNPKAKFPKP